MIRRRGILGAGPQTPAARRRAKKNEHFRVTRYGTELAGVLGFLLIQPRPSCKAVPGNKCFAGPLHDYHFISSFDFIKLISLIHLIDYFFFSFEIFSSLDFSKFANERTK